MAKNNARSLYIRKPVNAALDKLWEYPLTVVEAPMGYGKTTAVKEYLKNCDSEILWQTIMDESVTVFWNGFIRLFKKFDQVAAGNLADVGVPSNSLFLEEAVRLVEGIPFPARTVVVLDDYHLLSSTDIDRLVELLVRAEIPNLHLVLVSRSVFGENTGELVLKGYCWLIGKSCFVLSREEIIEYCRLCGVKLNADETDFLVSYTEGWISAVYLCLLGFLQDGRVEHQASLYELIEKVVYRRLAAEVRELLLSVCLFDSFTLEQAAYMWGREDVDPLLRQLTASNAFIRYEQASGLYSMHNIFTSYLRRIFDRQSVEQKRAVWNRAGDWQVNAGNCMHALDYFYIAANFDGLLKAIEFDKGNGIWNEHKDKLIRYFHDCPPAIKKAHVQACLIYAINLFSFNEMGLFAAQCAEIGSYIDALPQEMEYEKNQLLGEFELLCSFTKYNDIPGMYEHIQRAGCLLQGTSEFIDKKVSWTFGSPSVLYMFYRESGQLEQAVQEMNTAIPHYCRLTAGHGSGAEAVMQAERYYYTGDFQSAEIAAHKALYNAQAQEQTSMALCALFMQLRLAVIKGDLDYVTDSLRQTREEIKRQGLYSYLHTWEMCEGFVYAYLNLAKKIPDWIANGDLQDRSIYFPSYAFFNIIWGRSLLLSSQYLKLIGLTDNFIAIAGVFPNLLGQVYTYIYAAAAKLRLGQQEEARLTLRQALDIAAPDGIIMPFVENGSYIMELLTDLGKAGQHQEFIDAISRLLPVWKRQAEALAIKLSGAGRQLPLTEREWTIAEHITAGLTNREIGKVLHIAEVTVKKALQNIYMKLGIHSRTALTKIMLEHKQA